MISSLLAASSLAAVSQAPTAQLQIRGAAMFKNGYVVLTRSADVRTGSDIVIEDVPTSTLGTFWLSGEGGLVVNRAIVTSVEKETTTPLSTLVSILAANEGKRVRINLNGLQPGEPQEAIEGVLVSAKGQVIIVRTASGDVIVNRDRVVRLAILDGSAVYEQKSKTAQRVLKVNTNGRPGRIWIMTLQKGMAWSPSYVFDISKEKTLDLTARTVVLNDLEDFTDADVRFVTGFPNIRDLFALDPFTSGVTLDRLIAEAPKLAPGGGFRGGGMMQNAAAARMESDAMPAPSSGVETGGEGGEMVGDLFFYRQPNFTLKSGDRAYLNLFKKELPYRHVFTADLTGWTPDSGSQPDVWNTILFQNTGTPLTTAPAVTMKGGEVLGQDRLDYTADGAEGRLRITKSLEIQTDMVEEETARERGVIRNSDNRPIFDLVTLKVTLKARNLRKEESELDISRTHPGTVTVNDPAVKPTQISAGLSSANQMVKVRWQPKLRAGEKAETSYTYQVYVGSAFGR